MYVTANIDYYHGARHNRYEAYNCTWGVLMALNASYVDYSICLTTDDFPNETFIELFNDKNYANSEIYRLLVLNNLDVSWEDIQEIKKITSDTTIEIIEKHGVIDLILLFYKKDNRICCDFNQQQIFECLFYV